VKRTVQLCLLVLGLLPAAAHAYSPRIVGGSKVPITSVPWSVFIDASPDHYDCTGSIVDARHVLAAAHCAYPEGGGALRPASAYKIIAGSSDVSWYFSGGTRASQLRQQAADR
jgi:secreted trypsin-like serine protease